MMNLLFGRVIAQAYQAGGTRPSCREACGARRGDVHPAQRVPDGGRVAADDRPAVLPRSSNSGRVSLFVQLRKTTSEGVCTTDSARHSTRSRGSAPISRSDLRFRPSRCTTSKPMAPRKRRSASLTSLGDGVATSMRRAPRIRRVAMTAVVAAVAGMPEAVSTPRTLGGSPPSATGELMSMIPSRPVDPYTP